MSNPIRDDEYYSIPEVSQILKINRLTVRSRLEDKKEQGMPYMKTGDQYRILGEDIKKEFGSASYNSQPQESPKFEPGVPTRS